MGEDFGIFSLKGKVVVVTGGTKKYGYHFCKALADAEATVVLINNDRRQPCFRRRMDSVVKKWRKNEDI